MCIFVRGNELHTAFFKQFYLSFKKHKELCQFPSEFFYDGDLETAVEVLRRTPDNVTWPNGDGFPFAFHHVEGIEESLVVSTDQGNENSKKNQKEIAKVVSIQKFNLLLTGIESMPV